MGKRQQKKLTELLDIASPASIPEDWNFEHDNTRYLTFGLHDYPARLIPQIPERLIRRYLLKKGSQQKDLLVVDPFCGSSAVLTQARLLNLNTFGNDINPLATLIAKVHATPIHLDSFRSGLEQFQHSLNDALGSIAGRDRREVPIYEFPNHRHWFKKDVLRDLSLIRMVIQEQTDPDVQNFLNFCFSITQFAVSNIDKGSSRFIRIMKPNKLAAHHPRVFESFEKTKQHAAKRVIAFSETVDPSNYTTVNLGDTRTLPLTDESADIVVTSPPYGEEKNTIGYARWSKLSLYWLGLEKDYIRAQATLALGIKKADSIYSPSKSALKKLKIAAKIDSDRAMESVTFFDDYHTCLHEIARILPPQKYACIIVGNRSIKRIPVNMNTITIELAQTVDLFHVTTYFRGIPHKMIASTTPTGSTINQENIIIFQKR